MNKIVLKSKTTLRFMLLFYFPTPSLMYIELFLPFPAGSYHSCSSLFVSFIHFGLFLFDLLSIVS